MNVSNAVIRLTLVITNNWRSSIHGALGVHDRLQDFVIDIDQLKCILGDVAGVSDDISHLLPLETNFVGGKNCLRVVGKSRHPGEVVTE